MKPGRTLIRKLEKQKDGLATLHLRWRARASPIQPWSHRRIIALTPAILK